MSRNRNYRSRNRNYRGRSHRDPVGRGTNYWADGTEDTGDLYVRDGRFMVDDFDVTDAAFRDLGPRKARKVLRNPGRYAKKTARNRKRKGGR